MVAIRAHFNGTVIVPDEPVALSPQDQVVVLVNTTSSASTAGLEDEIRKYYQGEARDDDGWGEAVARDSRKAWEQE
ncbi:MAG: hypothetical protein ACREJC_21250 [Tepidisphaeraceae bacterium]